MRYLKDRETALSRLADLFTAIEWARYEAAAAVRVARELGITWDELAEVMPNVSGKSGASQWVKRNTTALAQLDEDEWQRVATLLGAGDRLPRWEVRLRVSGRPGKTRVVRQVLSSHLRRDVAEDRCRARPDWPERVELWRVDPTGHAMQMDVRRPEEIERDRRLRARIAEAVDDDGESPF